MNKRAIIIVTALLAFATWLAVSMLKAEPTFEQKPISHWLNQLPSRLLDPDGRGYSICFPGPVGTATEIRSNQSRKHAFKALDTIGTNCLPILLARIQSKDISFMRPVWDWAERWRIVEASSAREASFRRGQALTAFSYLGTRASSVAPQLLELTRNTETNLQFMAWYALEAVAPEQFHKQKHPPMVTHSRPGSFIPPTDTASQ